MSADGPMKSLDHEREKVGVGVKGFSLTPKKKKKPH